MDRNPTPFQTFGVLGALLAQAATLPDGDRNPILRAMFDYHGKIDIFMDTQDAAAALAALAGLPETSRTAQPDEAFGQQRIYHRIGWDGAYAGHAVGLSVGWFTDVPATDAQSEDGGIR